MAQAGPGHIRLFNDFGGPEIPLATDIIYGTTGGGTAYYLGDFSVKGKIHNGDPDAGVLAMGVTGGAARITCTDENGEGLAFTTDLCFQPSLNAPIVLEARVQLQALETRSIFIGLCGTIADVVKEPLTNTGTAHSYVADDLAGFVFDSQLTAKKWHACYRGGSAADETDSTATDTGIALVSGEYDILRLEIFQNGTVEYWINGNMESRVVGAVSATTLQGVICGIFGTVSTVVDMDVEYLLLTANRDWTR